MRDKRKNSVLKQASVLAVAGLIVRIIGLLYRSPMKAIIGAEGSGYYGYAYNVYTIMLLISSYSIPMAVSKVMAERIALKEYRNAQKVFRGALIYVSIVGGLAGAIIFLFAGFLLPRGQENAVLALKILAPTVLISGYLGVLRGYFQAHSTMVPTSISQIAEQAVNAIVSVAAAWFFTSSVVENAEKVAVWGAAGGTLGTGVGVVFGLLFMLFVYRVNAEGIRRKLRRDRNTNEETYREVFIIILMMVSPIILSTFVYNLSAYIDQTIFSNVLLGKGFDAKEIAVQYGIFSLQYMTMINIPVALASATSSTMVPTISGNYARGNIETVLAKINEGTRFTMFLAIPATVGMGVLGVPLMKILFPGGDALVAGHYLSIGCISVIFYCLSTISNGILQSISKPVLPVRNAGIALLINIGALYLLLLLFPQIGVTAVILATVFYSLSICLLNSLSIRAYLGYRNEWKENYGIPLAASLVMGLMVYSFYHLLAIILPKSYLGNLIAAAFSVCLGLFVYLIAYLVIGRVKEEELARYPMGRRLVKVARVLRIF